MLGEVTPCRRGSARPLGATDRAGQFAYQGGLYSLWYPGVHPRIFTLDPIGAHREKKPLPYNCYLL